MPYHVHIQETRIPVEISTEMRKLISSIRIELNWCSCMQDCLQWYWEFIKVTTTHTLNWTGHSIGNQRAPKAVFLISYPAVTTFSYKSALDPPGHLHLNGNVNAGSVSAKLIFCTAVPTSYYQDPDILCRLLGLPGSPKRKHYADRSYILTILTVITRLSKPQQVWYSCF